MEMTDVVTAFLVRPANAGVHVLVLRRSDKVGSYRGRWAGISGHLEAGEPIEQALTEINEEAGLPRSSVQLLASAPPIEIRDEELGRIWRVHPFLFEATDPDAIRIDWEHTELRWVDPRELRRLDTVPGLAGALETLLKSWRSQGRPRGQTKEVTAREGSD
jgi:8-oxo-dGTP diphosphatase